MKHLSHFCVFTWAIIAVLCSGCGENGLFGSSDDDDVIIYGNLNCPSGSLDGWCLGGSDCVDGACQCPDSNKVIRPGFCWSRISPAMFVTYDAHPDWVDTTIVAFDTDPYDLYFEELGPIGVELTGQIRQFSRGQHLGGGVGRLWPEESSEFDVPARVVIYSITLSNSTNERAKFNDGRVACYKTFRGDFVHRDTIRGLLHFTACSGDESSFPEEVTNPSHEMTWIRLR